MKQRLNFTYLPITISTLLLFSCGVKTKNDENTKNVEIVVNPELGVAVNAPKDVLYVPSANQKEQLKSKSSLFSSAEEEKSESGKNVYRAKGSGGLGTDFIEGLDSLYEYDGIPITITKNNIEPHVKIEGSGDKYCESIFTLKNNVIKIDTEKISTLTDCDIKITASGQTKSNVDITKSAIINVKINPTMEYYFQKTDPATSYLKLYSALSDVGLVAKWIKDANQINNLILKYDPNKTDLKKYKLSNINAITGAINVKSIDLSGTDLKDLKAISLLENLEKLDISSTKVDPKDLTLLSRLPKLKSLAVRNLDIKDIKYISNNLNNLVELDISNNTQIEDFKDLQNLKNLRVLKASNAGIVDLKKLTNLTQLNSLDVSNNDLSNMTIDDLELLVNLYNISELNFSKTRIKDEFLNAYFEGISNRNTLKKLVIRNYFNRGVSGDCDKINIIDNIPSLGKLTNIEYLDLHGNGCNNESGFFQKGLTMTTFFSSMSNLQYLDISDTAVWDLSGVLRLVNLKRLKLADDDGGISMTKEQCKEALREASVVGISSDCRLLNSGRQQSKSFTVPGSYTWIVPRNVTSVKITGCSGANGGAGGGGGGAPGANWSGSNDSYGGNGGNSGSVNGGGVVAGFSGRPGISCTIQGRVRFCRDMYGDSLEPKQHGGAGGNGQIGEGTKFGDQIFSLANQKIRNDSNNACLGGVSGTGGVGGTGGVEGGVGGSRNAINGPGGNGGSHSASGWNSKIESYSIATNSAQVIQILVGKGGAGGGGGAAGSRQNGYYPPGNNETNGTSGSAGANGFLKIEWEE
ncbi:leucine-rich repeat domain-containing protein [Fluviispira sanaruensis]|uniref:Uncharacterized protein n=1 Tax=Fluviispira sanaruensis TaxID=2493639 RepID=A0A4P2VP14_FLUSA|nr:leucine-rich repeat domain-containing protein [Fluviispira sanaruensis]BBH54708.1 hypothetical protein JCM31447_31820 [Fluviispira sanaruensis]